MVKMANTQAEQIATRDANGNINGYKPNPNFIKPFNPYADPKSPTGTTPKGYVGGTYNPKTGETTGGHPSEEVMAADAAAAGINVGGPNYAQVAAMNRRPNPKYQPVPVSVLAGADYTNVQIQNYPDRTVYNYAQIQPPSPVSSNPNYITVPEPFIATLPGVPNPRSITVPAPFKATYQSPQDIATNAALWGIPSILFGGAQILQEQISKYGESGKIAAPSVIPKDAPFGGNILVSGAVGMVSLIPAVLSLPYALTWSAYHPTNVPSKAVDILTGMATQTVKEEMKHPGSFIGTIGGMYVGGKIIGYGGAKVVEKFPLKIDTAEVPIGYTSVPSATDVFIRGKLSGSPIIQGIVDQFNLVNEFESVNKYTYLKWGGSETAPSRIIGGVAYGGEVSPTVFVGRSGIENIIVQTHVNIPTSFAKYAPYEWSMAQSDVLVPFIERTGGTPFVSSAVTLPRDLARSSTNLKYSPYQPIGLAEQADVNFGTSIKIQASLGVAGKESVVVGSRSQVDLWGQQYFRDVSGSDIDISANLPVQNAMRTNLIPAYAGSEIVPKRVGIWDATLTEMPSGLFTVPKGNPLVATPPENRGFSFGVPGKEHTLGVHPLEYNVDVQGMPVINIAGTQTWIQTPENALLTKASRVMGSGSKAEIPASFIYEPSTGKTTLRTTGGKQVTDLADMYSISRGIAATAYKQGLFDLGKAFETRSDALAGRLSELPGDMTEGKTIGNIIPEDILKGLLRSPPKISAIMGVGFGGLMDLPKKVEAYPSTPPKVAKGAGTGYTLPALYPTGTMQPKTQVAVYPTSQLTLKSEEVPYPTTAIMTPNVKYPIGNTTPYPSKVVIPYPGKTTVPYPDTGSTPYPRKTTVPYPDDTIIPYTGKTTIKYPDTKIYPDTENYPVAGRVIIPWNIPVTQFIPPKEETFLDYLPKRRQQKGKRFGEVFSFAKYPGFKVPTRMLTKKFQSVPKQFNEVFSLAKNPGSAKVPNPFNLNPVKRRRRK
jgi:hypothetical protein